MKWENITVGQFQDINQLSLSADIDEIEKLSRIVCILYNKTESEVDEMSMAEFNELVKQCKFILADGTPNIPGKPVKSFSVNGRKYAINYKPTSLKQRQYVEILHFSEKPIDNLHFILASLVNPVKWFVKQPNKAEDHERIANDMLSAPLPVVYHACVFFCKLYRDSIAAMQDYLVKEMTQKGMKKEQANHLIAISLSAMDGFIPQSK